MSVDYRKILHFSAAVESTTIAEARRWFHAEDTGRLVITRQDGATRDYFWNSLSMSSTSATMGTALLGTIGITGITPQGGSLGAAATLQNMLRGVAQSVILKSPYNSIVNTIQPTGNYVPFAIKSFSGGTSNLFEAYAASGLIALWVDYPGNLNLSRDDTGNVAIQVINSNNTIGASNALILLSTGGGSAGDAYIRNNINTVIDWSYGVQRSTQAWKISQATALGTNDALIIAPSGAITLNRAVIAGFTLSVTGTLTGAAANFSSLGVTGAATFGSSLDLTGALKVGPSGTGNPSAETADITITAGTSGDVVASLTQRGFRTSDNAFSTRYTYHGTNLVGKESWVRDGANDAAAWNLQTKPTGGALTQRISISSAGAVLISGVVTFSSAPVFSSVSAGQILGVNGSKALVGFATNGSGAVVLSTSASLTTPDIGAAGGSTLTLSSQLIINSTGANQICLNSSGTNYGFLSNPSANTWALAYGTTIGTLGTAALTWNNSGAITIPGTLSVTGTTTLASDLIFSNTNWIIRANTADGSDSKALFMTAGGSYDATNGTRGACILLTGNEYSAGNGLVQISAGNTTTSRIQVQMASNVNAAFILSDRAGNEYVEADTDLGIFGIMVDTGFGSTMVNAGALPSTSGQDCPNTVATPLYLKARHWNGASWDKIWINAVPNKVIP